jgi:hypothetical protein
MSDLPPRITRRGLPIGLFEDPRDLMKLMALAECGYWKAFDSLLEREGIIDEQKMTRPEVKEQIIKQLHLEKSFTCCICHQQSFGWGHNPDPVCTDEDARCCLKCNNSAVLTARIREASRAHAVVTRR